MLFLFFSSRRRHTRLQGDWSSDVCSSDLKTSIRWFDSDRRLWSGRGGRPPSPPILVRLPATPPPRPHKRPVVVGVTEPEAHRDPGAIRGIPPAGPRVRTDPADVARRRPDRVARDVVVEVIPGPPTPLHEGQQARFGIGTHG